MGPRAPWPSVVLALALGAAGFVVGRASVPAHAPAPGAAERDVVPGGDGPMLRGIPGRRPPDRGSLPGEATGSDSAGASDPGTTQSTLAAVRGVLTGNRFFDLGSLKFVEGTLGEGGFWVPPARAETAQPERERVAAARTALAADPERANDLLEDLLTSSEPEERAAAYALLGGARHALQRPLATRALEEARPDDDVRALLDALARYKGRPWSAAQLTGAPDTPFAGDLPTAWASKTPDMGEVWLELDFATPVLVESVRIHETLGPGCVARILLAQGETREGEPQRWLEVWSGTADPGAAPRWFAPPLGASVYTRHVLLIVDTNRVPGWNEIDAVQLLGSGQAQWASAARAGSSYAD